ncbi:MAG TPA: hypothetical protein VIZ21_09350 [Ignavibacteriaceae bacterium]
MRWLLVYNDINYINVVKIIFKQGFFDFTDKQYCCRFYSSGTFFQAPINNTTIRIVTSVMNIARFLTV